MELHFYGELHDCADCFGRYAESVGREVLLHGPVARAEAYRAMLGADVLLNIGNDTRYQLPSKVVDYASTGGAVINVVRSDEDSSVRFFERYPAVLNLVDHGNGVTPAQVRAVRDFIQTHAGRRVPPSQLRWLDDYGLEAVADAYQGLLMRPSEVPA